MTKKLESLIVSKEKAKIEKLKAETNKLNIESRYHMFTVAPFLFGAIVAVMKIFSWTVDLFS